MSKKHPLDLGGGITELDESSVSIDADFSWILNADRNRITCSIESEEVFRIIADKYQTGHYNLFIQLDPFPRGKGYMDRDEPEAIAELLRRAADAWDVYNGKPK